ncbi:Zinc finger MYM-type protein 6 [Plecturocebus cupreus]
MSKKQTSLESFFEKAERTDGETAEDSKTANKKKAAFKRKYQESYLNYRLIAAGDSHSPSLLSVICGNQLSHEAMKPSKLLCHMETKQPALKDKPLETEAIIEGHHFVKGVCTEASFLVANHIAKAKKLFTIGEELILPAAKDISTTITRQIDEIPENTEEDVHEDMLCALLLPTNTTAAELFKSLNDYILGKLNWSLFVGICIDRVTAMTG